MERHADTHLIPEELDTLLRSDADAPEARQHLGNCDICRSLLEAHAEEDARLAQLKTSEPGAPGPDCPRESQWLKIASGMTRGSEADALVRHSASCDHCGPLFRQALEDFAGDVSSDEEAMLAGLRSSGREWQERMSADLTKSRSPRGILAWLRETLREKLGEHLFVAPRVPIWAYSAGVAALCGGAALFYMQQPSIDNLLATAYTEQRTLELRIPDAAYAPVRLVRGSSDRSRLDRPSTLLTGEARIARELEKNPDSPRWIAARGRAELLERDYDSAIASFQKALGFQPDSYALMTDLASAFFERAEANNSQPDFNLAVASLNLALNAKPDDPVALFNRAIIYERLHLYDRAIEDWQHYLRVDRTSAWVGEAKQHLADAQTRRF